MIINFSNIGSGTGGGTPSPSSSNYRIVDALSAITNPTEGLMAYVKSREKVTNGIRFEISNWENFQKNSEGNAEDFLARVHWGDWDESTQSAEELVAEQIYQSGNNFYWGWNNDGNLNYKDLERDGVHYQIMYQTHNVEGNGYGCYFDFYPIDETPWGDYKFALNGNNTVSATTIQHTAIIPGQTYVYSAGQWVEIASTTFVWEDIAPSTTAETAALLEEIRASVARGIYPSIFYQNHICNYSGGNSQWVNFDAVFGYNRNVVFYISDQIFNENGFNSVGIRIEDHEFVYGYNLPVASANELGGVKIGQGISIDQDGVISAQGGGSGGYNVVDSFPATGSATEGALYYLKAYVESVDYRGISITTTASEGYAAHIYDGKGNEKSVYISGTDFHWGYQNDGEYHKKDDAEFWYKTNNANKTINVYLPDDSWTVTLEEGATSAETTPYTVQIPHDAQTYRFNGTGYTVAGGYDDIYLYFDYNDKDNAEKKQALADSISAVQPESRKNIRLFVSNLSSNYIRSLEGNPYILFMPTLDRQDGIFFTANIFPHNGGGAHDNPVFINCYVGFNGGFAFQMVQAPSLFVLNVDPVSHALNNNGQGWMVIRRTASNDGRVRPIIQLSYNGTIFNAVYKGSQFDAGRIYLDAKHEGKNLHGVWEVSDDYCNLVEWSENPDTYQSVSGLSNAGIDTASFVDDWYSIPANVITSLTEETELFVNKMYDNKCKVTTDGTAIKMYGEDGAGGWVLRGSGTWADSSIGTTDIGNNPGIYNITTGSTTYQFRFVYNDYQDPGTTISKTHFYKPFEGLLAFDKSNSSLNLYAGGQWRTVYQQA